MSYVVLARKWRPMSFADLVGQSHVSQTLANAIAVGRVAHAFLFTGVRGVGKTTSARILAKALNCMRPPGTVPAGEDPGPTAEPCLGCPACRDIAEGSDVDVQEIDGASYNGVDEVRRLQDSLPYRPARDRFKIYIVDEVHMLSQSAWNAFLKTLEEPPPHVKFIFATTEVHKIPVTILSRVQRFDFKMIPTATIAARLKYVLEQEGIAAEDTAVNTLAREAGGSMRDAMSLLDQVIAFNSEMVRADEVSRVLGVAGRKVLYDLTEALLSGDSQQCLVLIAEVSNQGFDIGHVARDLLGVLRDVVVCKVCKDTTGLFDLPDQELDDVRRLADSKATDDLIRVHQAFSRSFDDVVRSAAPKAALEMLLIRLAQRPPLVPLDHLMSRLEQLEQRISAAGRGPSGPGPAGSSGPGGRPGGSGPGGRPPAGRPRPASSKPVLPSGGPTATTLGQAVIVDRSAKSSPAETEVASGSGPNSGSTSEALAGDNTASSGFPAMSPTMDEAFEESAVPQVSAVPHPGPRSERQRTEPQLNGSDAQRQRIEPQLNGSDAQRNGTPLGKASHQRPLPSGPQLNGELAAFGAASEEGEPEPLVVWRSIVTRIEQDRPDLASVLKQVAPTSVTPEELALTIEKGGVFESTLSSGAIRALVQRAATAHFGQTPQILLEVKQSVAPTDTLAGRDQERRSERERLRIEEAKRHPRVLDAISLLGARIKEVRLTED